MMPLVSEFNLYETLEVAKDATEQEIVTSYRKLARVHHPDKNPNDSEATARFQRKPPADGYLQIQTAYETLKDSSLRSHYDCRLEHPTYTSHSASSHGRYRDRSGEYADSFEDFDEERFFAVFFEQIFGRSGGFDGFSMPTDGHWSSIGGRRSSGPHGSYGFQGFPFSNSRTPFEEEEDRRQQEIRRKQQEEARRRAAEYAAEKQRRENEKKCEEVIKRLEKELEKRESKVRQEARWAEAGLMNETDKQKTCHHDAFWEKVLQKRKFKCGQCGKKRGMASFKCPHCGLLACQLCATSMRKRSTVA